MAGESSCITSGARAGNVSAYGNSSPLRSVLLDIKTENAKLHNKTFREGVYYAFGDGKKPIELLDVEARLERGEPVKFTAIQYQKASGWLIGATICLGGSWPVLEGADLKSMRFALKRELTSPNDLLRAYEDVRLAA